MMKVRKNTMDKLIVKVMLGNAEGIALIYTHEWDYVFYMLDYVPDDFEDDMEAFVMAHINEGYSMVGTLEECIDELNNSIRAVLINS